MATITSKHEFKYNDKDQAVDYRKNQLGLYPGDYDPLGRLSRDRSRHTYKYSSNDLLLEVKIDNRIVISYFYDHLGRMVGRKDSLGGAAQYFYADSTKPFLVSHVFRPKEGVVTSLLYDQDDRLIFAQVGGDGGQQQHTYYVVSDRMGSPAFFYTSFGLLVRQVTRLPYGHVIEDTSPHMGVPIGFGGAIFDDVADLSHFQVSIKAKLLLCLL